jgi:hypothetical protein
VVKNPHDPDVQWACKDQTKKKQWEGYKVQIVESVAEDQGPKQKGEPTEQFVTEATTTEAIASDLDGRERVENNQREHGEGVAEELYVDAAYVTDDTLAKAHAQGRELMGPARPSANPSGKDLFDATAFDVKVAQRKAVCPAGHESRQCIRLHNQQSGQVNYRFEWGSLCDDWHLRGNVPGAEAAVECWWLESITTNSSNGVQRCKPRSLARRCSNETGSKGRSVSLPEPGEDEPVIEV